MRSGAALIWTCLQLWAPAKPVERRTMIPLIIVPVIAGPVVAEFLALEAEFLDVASSGSFATAAVRSRTERRFLNA